MNNDKSEVALWIGKAGAALGRGLIAGLAGTAAITLSQWIERKIDDQPPSFAPADGASKALRIEAADQKAWASFSDKVHWTYGTLWGAARGLLSLAHLKGVPATFVHFAAIYYVALRIEPDLEVAPPLNEWPKADIAMFGLHHLLYVTVAGMVFDAINKDGTEGEDKTRKPR